MFCCFHLLTSQTKVNITLPSSFYFIIYLLFYNLILLTCYYFISTASLALPVTEILFPLPLQIDANKEIITKQSQFYMRVQMVSCW